MKYFIITVDTEGDNLWDYKPGDKISTKNAVFLPRFQELSEKFGFKPVYLTNYEMTESDIFVRCASEWLRRQSCEVGIHLHAWNNPPFFDLCGKYSYNPYLIEYPTEIMHEKFDFMYNQLLNKFGIRPISHRAGRWAMDKRYYELLREYGVKVDCSHTPSVDWSRNVGITRGGCDYSRVSNAPSMINGVLEVPVTIRTFHHSSVGSLRHRIRTLLQGEQVWLRPTSFSYQVIKKLIDRITADSKVDYAQFMIHSSELMPGGSPFFRDTDAVEKLYDTITSIYKLISDNGYVGVTLSDYYTIHNV